MDEHGADAPLKRAREKETRSGRAADASGAVPRGRGLGLAAVVGGILGTRLLGLSLVLPGFAAHGATLTNDLTLVGIAFGGYAATMAVLQVPLGAASDRWGRRPVLVAGLGVAALGAFGAAAATSIGLLIAARLVQGAGAVNGVALAALGERVPEDRRNTALAIVGAMIGVAFSGGLVIGAAVTPFIGVPGLFVVNGVLGLAAAAAAVFAFPAVRATQPAARLADVVAAFRSRRVLGLAGAAAATNVALHAVLFVFPLSAGAFLTPTRASWALAGVVIAGGLAMFAGARRADQGGADTTAAVAAVALGAGAVAVAGANGLVALLAGGVVFFAGQSVLAALLPGFASRDAPPRGRASAQAAQQLAGYVGIVAGATIAGAWVARPLWLMVALGVAGLAAFVALTASGSTRTRASG